MRAANERGGEVEDEVSRLENEVASWRSGRIQRRGTTTGKVHVVRISKRVVPQSGPSADQTSATARP
ncbi:hypothetical protein FBZ94_102165 [Bradyrhizobium sacchari]|uniref:Uncharacterized protein n=1 Tax=Bradyrhizobium sacchari TaxID=1399419 RepID=A0A560J1H2_9BRAD|nr:hypothetical protein FBZ94_102165 [Bradyrhizobium sacchari]TWB80949.1 hypothetical protein FBZ95_102166 [Bradyrhizobium sacchari]